MFDFGYRAVRRLLGFDWGGGDESGVSPTTEGTCSITIGPYAYSTMTLGNTPNVVISLAAHGRCTIELEPL